jgi:hypothetical protein
MSVLKRSLKSCSVSVSSKFVYERIQAALQEFETAPLGRHSNVFKLYRMAGFANHGRLARKVAVFTALTRRLGRNGGNGHFQCAVRETEGYRHKHVGTEGRREKRTRV